jgi:pyrimidine-nucleoside phosphorylase
MSQIHPIDVIQHKRDGHSLSDAEIRAFIRAIVDRTPDNQLVTDAQIAAFLMAVFLRGLDPRELATLTEAMRFSGEVAYTEALNTFAIDKHSTGGVGDKTSLLIAPIIAAAGLAHPTPDGVPGIVVPSVTPEAHSISSRPSPASTPSSPSPRCATSSATAEPP